MWWWLVLVPALALLVVAALIFTMRAWRLRSWRVEEGEERFFLLEKSWWGPLVVARRPEDGRQLLGDEERLQRDIPGLEADRRRFGSVQVFTAHNGAEHQTHRRLVAASMRREFSPLLRQMVERRSALLISHIAAHSSENQDLPDLFPFFVRFVSGSIAEFVYGSTSEPREQAKAAIPLFARILSFVAPVWTQDIMEVVLPPMKLVRAARELDEKLNREMIDGFVEGRDHDTLMYLLQQSNDKGLVSQKDLFANAGIFSAGGTDSTASVLTSAVYCLCKYPEMQPLVATDDIFRSVFLKEVLRMFPPFPVIGFRYSQEDGYMFGKQRIPSGVPVCINLLASQRDPEFWGPDAADFRPERWLDESQLPERRFYFPWGAGPRLCVGKPLALAILNGFLTTLCQSYMMSFAANQAVPPPPTKNALAGVTSPEKPLSVRFIPRF